jgi:starch synthase
MSNERLRVLYAASEVAGFAKTGGLADVAGSLPRALVERGIDCAVIMPLYRAVRKTASGLTDTRKRLEIPIGPRTVAGGLWRGTLPDSDVPIYFVDQPEYFDRDDPATGRSLYQLVQADGKRADYPDNCERFIFFARAILEAVRLLDLQPHVLHLNDWQTALVPVYLREVYQKQRQQAARARYADIHTLITIHNMAFQGVFWHYDMPLTGLSWDLFNYEQLEFYGHINFLKGGIVFADLINAVSPTYAREIQTPYFGCGLQGVLHARADRLFGIVNGVDYRLWNPATDRTLPANYDVKQLAGKAACKAHLQRHYGLPESPRAPLFGMVTRLTDQKGLDLLSEALPELLAQDVQVAVLGEGEPKYHEMLVSLQRRFPRKLGVTLKVDEKLAHWIEAGADIFFMPSQFEPCGLSQLFSLKYGTVPLVRSTGGLADTVVDATAENLASGKATGFAFQAYTARAFLDTVQRALTMFRGETKRWLALQQTGMRQDWSWSRSAAEYERLYLALAGEVSLR